MKYDKEFKDILNGLRRHTLNLLFDAALLIGIGVKAYKFYLIFTVHNS